MKGIWGKRSPSLKFSEGTEEWKPLNGVIPSPKRSVKKALIKN